MSSIFIWGPVAFVVFASGFYAINYEEQIERDPYWYQHGVVLEKYNNWYGKEALVLADDGKRYLDYCRKCLVDDKVKIRMYNSTQGPDFVSAIIILDSNE